VSEPRERARRIVRVALDIVRWSVHQSRIGGYPGESYAVQSRGGTVLIDPLPLEDAALEKLTAALGPVIAIALSIQSHQRASWRYRQHFGVDVYAPRGAQGLDEKPDVSYRAGAKLPGGLTAIALPGPAFSGHGFFWRSSAGRALFCGDLLTRAGRLAFVSDQYMDAPDLARKSARRLLSLKIDLLCPGHGAPLIGGVRREIAALLGRDRR
jgi:glyoxylase-like metal-dependent hydrolase (beta-lactamase superfamily II)